MRLIDADLLTEEIESLRCTLTGLRAGKGVLARAADEYRKSILQIISDQPTAFDKEKVIEELTIRKKIADERAANYDESGDIQNMETQDSISLSFKSAVEIVEKGGIE